MEGLEQRAVTGSPRLNQGKFMETLKKRDFLQEVVTKHGYYGWYVIEPLGWNPENCLLFNPTEKKMGEISIPDAWLEDPDRRSAIGELLASTIHNCTYALPQGQPSSSPLSSRP